MNDEQKAYLLLQTHSLFRLESSSDSRSNLGRLDPIAQSREGARNPRILGRCEIRHHQNQEQSLKAY